jgi:hypothetical protein
MGGVKMARVSGFVDGRTFLQFDFAFTAIAAAGATIAEVIGTGVLGASGADTCGFLAANTTVERHD